MTLTELRYIVTLAQEQHFGHAAERCHVSQPTLSVGVKKLEDELGVLISSAAKALCVSRLWVKASLPKRKRCLSKRKASESWLRLVKTN